MLETTKPGVRAVRTFVFTDIVDSTRLVEVLGDEAWENLLAWHDRTLRGCFAQCHGEEVKHEGDGFFVAFPDGTSAVTCAVNVQRTLAAHRRDHGFAPQVRIGIHTAEATGRDGDYTGRGVHVAARVAAAAGAGEIVASQDALDSVVTVEVTGHRSLELKGLAQPVEVATILWED
jgi:class 3 adenylate cyclase